MYVHVPNAAPSKRTQRLAGKIMDTVLGYETQEPNLSHLEVQQALRIAGAELSASMGGRVQGARIAATVLGALFAVGLGLYVALRFKGGGGASETPWIMIAAVTLGIIMLLAVVMGRSRDR